jgi:cyclopropane fatty-acyl-phospholipid synthase-like methyltransferase
MSSDPAGAKPEGYWDRAGVQGYAEAMYNSAYVEQHLRGRLWQVAMDIAATLGVPPDSHVLDLGCGDGAFTNQVLAPHYRSVEGIDISDAAIRRAQAETRSNATYRAVDLVTFDYDSLSRYDAAFLMGILHHVKAATPDIVRAMARRTDKLIVLEPNGNHLLRKALEYTPSYRDAGEDSFGAKSLMKIFAAAGWKTVVWRRLNLFPNFTPGFVYRTLAPIEPFVEGNRFLRALCTTDMYGLTRA